jgi:hypothetical protein
MAYDETTDRRGTETTDRRGTEATYRRDTGGQDGDDPAAYRTGPAATDFRARRRDLDPDRGDAEAAQLAEFAPEPGRRGGGPGSEDGRDRLGIHIGWEIVLLLAVAAIAYLLYRLDPAGLRRPALDTLLITATTAWSGPSCRP